MRHRVLQSSNLLIMAVFAVAALGGRPALGAFLTADLNCTPTGPSSVFCDPVTSYGTVTLDDSVGGGQILLTVEVQGVAGKFRDLMLNLEAAEITTLSSSDGQASLDPDGFFLPPYQGKFDIGNSSDTQGWHSSSGYYSTLLSGNLPLTLAMFNVPDTLGKVNVAVQLQDLTGPGDRSVKVEGVWEGSPLDEVPEPPTVALIGVGLIVLARTFRRRAC